MNTEWDFKTSDDELASLKKDMSDLYEGEDITIPVNTLANLVNDVEAILSSRKFLIARMRKQFEKWYSATYALSLIRTSPDAVYYEFHAQSCWSAWIASASLEDKEELNIEGMIDFANRVLSNVEPNPVAEGLARIVIKQGALLRTKDWIHVSKELPNFGSIVTIWDKRENTWCKAEFCESAEGVGHFDTFAYDENPQVLLPFKHVDYWKHEMPPSSEGKHD